MTLSTQATQAIMGGLQALSVDAYLAGISDVPVDVLEDSAAYAVALRLQKEGIKAEDPQEARRQLDDIVKGSKRPELGHAVEMLSLIGPQRFANAVRFVDTEARTTAIAAKTPEAEDARFWMWEKAWTQEAQKFVNDMIKRGEAPEKINMAIAAIVTDPRPMTSEEADAAMEACGGRQGSVKWIEKSLEANQLVDELRELAELYPRYFRKAHRLVLERAAKASNERAAAILETLRSKNPDLFAN